MGVHQEQLFFPSLLYYLHGNRIVVYLSYKLVWKYPFRDNWRNIPYGCDVMEFLKFIPLHKFFLMLGPPLIAAVSISDQISEPGLQFDYFFPTNSSTSLLAFSKSSFASPLSLFALSFLFWTSLAILSWREKGGRAIKIFKKPFGDRCLFVYPRLYID